MSIGPVRGTSSWRDLHSVPETLRFHQGILGTRTNRPSKLPNASSWSLQNRAEIARIWPIFGMVATAPKASVGISEGCYLTEFFLQYFGVEELKIKPSIAL